MNGLLAKVSVVAALVAAVVVPAASARPASAVKLSLVPLQKAQLGAAKSLPLDSQSGVLSDDAAASRSPGPASPSALKKLGRITGYGLGNGVDASGGSGITEVWTAADEYKTAADAKKAVAYWKKSDSGVVFLNQGGFSVTSTGLRVPSVGSARFADLISYSAANIVPLYNVDEQFADGRYELDVSVSAGTAGAARQLSTALAKKLDARLRQELAGTLHAKPVKVPAGPKAGAPAGGPDLSPLALKTTDLSGTATVKSQGYYADPNALSDYGVIMFPAGPFDLLDQEIEWYPTANQANFEADWSLASFVAGGGTQIGFPGVGDGVQGAVANGSKGGFGTIVFSSGHLAEFITVGSQSAVQANDVQNTAQTAANYINNAGLGS